MQFTITQDGSPTIYDPIFKEHHHSLIGAYTEARYKFAEVAKSLFTARSTISSTIKPAISLLDLPFGLGYNLIATLDVFDNTFINCTAIELDLAVLEALPLCPFDEELKQKFVKLFPLAEGKKRIQKSNFNLELILGDLLEVLPELAATEHNKYDLIFYDSFSPRSAPGLWSKDNVLKYFYELLKEDGLLITYTASNKVRKGLLELGFQIAPSVSVGRKMPGTLAFKAGKNNPLSFTKLQSFTEETWQKINKSASYKSVQRE
ncbi:MAG: MnmC family methyltransferase [Candidatus Caenarcaniphilales bacterium]|nr:MnmC family methyltransferase [Candidatus Caenarcaniphilales bacterium]